MTNLIAPIAYEMKIQSLRLSPLAARLRDLRQPQPANNMQAALATMFMGLCQDEAKRTGNDVWVGFTWTAFLKKGCEVIFDRSVPSTESWILYGIRKMIETNHLRPKVAPDHLNVLFPTSRLLKD